jgi:hypothetical protein
MLAIAGISLSLLLSLSDGADGVVEASTLARRMVYAGSDFCHSSVCDECNPDGIHCSQCKSGLFTPEWDQACVSCSDTHANCAACCTGAGCVDCQDGYHYDNGNCVEVPQCGDYYGGYYQPCAECNYDGGFCETCSAGWWKLTWDGFCEHCLYIYHCNECGSYVGCTDCGVGFQVVFDPSVGYNRCQEIPQCIYGCGNCNEAGGFCDACDANHYKHVWNGFCHDCYYISNCAECGDYTGCVQCDAGYHTYWNGAANEHLCAPNAGGAGADDDDDV